MRPALSGGKGTRWTRRRTSRLGSIIVRSTRLQLGNYAADQNGLLVGMLDLLAAGDAQQLARHAERNAGHAAACSTQDEAKVEKQAGIFDVIEVERKLTANAGQVGIRGQLHLRQTRAPRTDQQPFPPTGDRLAQLRP